VLASDLEYGLVRVDLLSLHQEPHVASRRVVEGQLHAVVHARPVRHLQKNSVVEPEPELKP
jgi:hypothetical protein